MNYRDYPPLNPLLIGYDPAVDVPHDHLARLIDKVVDETVAVAYQPRRRGNLAYDPRVCVKVITFAYCVGVRTCRQMEEMCRDRLSTKLLTRGQVPCYHTLSSAVVQHKELLKQVWVGLFAVAKELGIERCGRITLDSTKIRANAGPEAVVKQCEFDSVLLELDRILAEADQAEAADREGNFSQTLTGTQVSTEHVRDILRRVRKKPRKASGSKTAANKRTTDDKNSTQGEVTTEATESAADNQETENVAATDKPDAMEETQPPANPVCDPLPASPPKRLTKRMRKRLELAKAAIETAQAEGLKHACVTDPDARMMAGTRQNRIQECHSLEVAVDNGLIVVGQATQVSDDNSRLAEIVNAARSADPFCDTMITAVTADSGYYSGDTVADLVTAGVDTCIPDNHTICDVRRKLPIGTTAGKGEADVTLTFDQENNCYRCPEGNNLKLTQTRQCNGQMVNVYRAERDCSGCPLADRCLKHSKAKRRTLKIGLQHELLDKERKRFAEKEHVDRYRKRAPQIETIFGFTRQTLGINGWQRRGKTGVDAEATLITLAYQFRKLHKMWAQAPC